uniref:Uncharacterized protein n=1 Tax=Arundo donax TaxID=35708 RepID=A0A0A9EIF3_ARUDO
MRIKENLRHPKRRVDRLHSLPTSNCIISSLALQIREVRIFYLVCHSMSCVGRSS